MKKQLSIILALFLFVAFTTVNAQGKISLSVGPEVAIPMGNFGDLSGIGFGGSVGGELNLADNINGFVTVGYLTFGDKDVSNITYSFTAIPIIVGAKYYIGKGGFYTMAETGFHLWTAKVESPGVVVNGVTFGGGSAETTSTEFTYGVGVGYEIGKFDVNAKYIGAGSNLTYIGIRASYKFAL